MQTEEELEEAKKAIARDAQLEAEKPLLSRAGDRYWEWRARNNAAFNIGLAVFVIVSVTGIIVKACNMH